MEATVYVRVVDEYSHGWFFIGIVKTNSENTKQPLYLTTTLSSLKDKI